MTIIDYMRQKLSEYPGISGFLPCGGMHIDFTDPDPTGYGLSSTGDSLVKEDVLGNQTRRHNFVLYAVGQSYTDYNRLANSNFLLELSYWLERLPEGDTLEAEVDGKAVHGRFVKAASANAMAMQPMTEDINDGVLYQIQIYATYKIESEELL